MSTKSRETNRERRRNERTAKRSSRHVTELDPQALMEALGWVLTRGGAMRIGMTRDCGAWAFGFYGDGDEPYTEYTGSDEDVNDYLRGVAKYWQEIDASRE